jgi:hypothetical protein
MSMRPYFLTVFHYPLKRYVLTEVVAMPTVLVVVCAVVAMASLIVAVVGWTRKHRTISAAI